VSVADSADGHNAGAAYDVRDVSALLRLSTKTVRKLARAGEIPGRQIGKKWRFPRPLIDAIVSGSDDGFGS